MKRFATAAAAILGLAAFSQSAIAEIVEGRTQHDRRYVAGGIGLDEADQMRQRAAQFPLSITLAHPRGAFLAQNEVRIRDGRGQVVFDQTVDAPMLLIDLPAGSYTIEASNRGQSQQRRVTVGQGSRQNVVLTFNVPVDEPGTMAEQQQRGAGVLGQQSDLPRQQRDDAQRLQNADRQRETQSSPRPYSPGAIDNTRPGAATPR